MLGTTITMDETRQWAMVPSTGLDELSAETTKIPVQQELESVVEERTAVRQVQVCEVEEVAIGTLVTIDGTEIFMHTCVRPITTHTCTCATVRNTLPTADSPPELGSVLRMKIPLLNITRAIGCLSSVHTNAHEEVLYKCGSSITCVCL